jgi:hypothetical protein
VALIGFLAKLAKAQKQLKAGSSVSGLLSEEGYISTAVAKAQVSASSAVALEATISKAEGVAEAKVADLKK